MVITDPSKQAKQIAVAATRIGAMIEPCVPNSARENWFDVSPVRAA